ncbi:MAG: hypothetical protein KF718_15385 [Polyangiaceae bacterium]|nr:hypothetical protein [Polyangiaceae bacterium]
MSRVSRIVSSVCMVGLGVSLALGNVACSGGQATTKVAVVKAGDMPSGGDWTGVYFSKTYGYLHLVLEGDTLSGRWRNAAGDKWGEMSGKVVGDLFRYEWKEHTIGMVGPSSTSKGKGYFKYKVPNPDESHEIHGEWGLNSDEVGHTWQAVKQTNMRADPASVMPDEVEGRTPNVGGWDDKPGEQPAPQE